MNAKDLFELRKSAYRCIAEEQRENGEIPTYEYYPTLPHLSHLGWHYNLPSPFIHACVLSSLIGSDDEEAKEVVRRGEAFILKMKEEQDLWRFWNAPSPKNPVLFDVDDTSLCSFVLEQLGHSTKGREVIYRNLNSKGDPYTWVWPRAKMLFHSPRLFFILRGQVRQAKEVLDTRLLYKDDTEPAIAANVLLYIGKDNRPEVAMIAKRVVDAWLKDAIAFQFYYSKLILAYHVSRAFANGCNIVGQLKDGMLRMLQEEMDSYSLPELFLAGIIFHNFGESVLSAELVRPRVLAMMGHEGFQWQPYPYFTSKNRLFFAGARSLTAAWFLEASADW